MNRTCPITTLIDDVVGSVPGWTPPDQLLALYTLAIGTAPLKGDFFEVGSWCGRSTVVLAKAAQQIGCTVQCVDLFPSKDDWKQNSDGTWSFYAEDTLAYGEQTVWDEPFQRDIAPIYKKHNSVLDVFLKSLKEFGVENDVRFFKGTTTKFSAVCGDARYRLAFIDGDHSEFAVKNDIDFVRGHLTSYGLICFDDAFSSYVGVNDAITKNIFSDDHCVYSQQLTRKFHAACMCE